MSVTKFVNEQDDSHAGRLWWPGHMGLPVRAATPATLTQAELDAQIEEVFDFHEAEFDLTDPEQHARYVQVMDRVVNGWYRLLFVERWRDEAGGRRLVRIEWAQAYGELNRQAAAAGIARVG